MNPTVDLSAVPLRDIHLPGAISWWPPAPGWWVLAVLATLGAVVVGLYYWRERHRRAALRALRQVQTALGRGAEPVVCLQQVSTVLRRFAMTRARHGAVIGVPVAGLIGERWLAYLDECWQRDVFRRGAGRALLAAPYGRPNTIDREAALDLVELCTAWIRSQRSANTLRASGA
jgi:uncharacterized protein DUF4381